MALTYAGSYYRRGAVGCTPTLFNDFPGVAQYY
jgi:hypothetical protein